MEERQNLGESGEWLVAFWKPTIHPLLSARASYRVYSIHSDPMSQSGGNVLLQRCVSLLEPTCSVLGFWRQNRDFCEKERFL